MYTAANFHAAVGVPVAEWDQRAGFLQGFKHPRDGVLARSVEFFQVQAGVRLYVDPDIFVLNPRVAEFGVQVGGGVSDAYGETLEEDFSGRERINVLFRFHSFGC